MKLLGRIILDEKPGRDIPGHKKLEKDYFLALRIVEIDGKPIDKSSDLYSALFKDFPEIRVGGESINHLLTNITLPRYATDMSHFTLGYFPNFRINNSLDEDINPVILAAARKLINVELEFEVSANNFELACATNSELLRKNMKRLIETTASTTHTSSVGPGRDAVLSIKPTEEIQKQLQDLACKVFGSEFHITNSKGEKVPYHLTVAQTNQMTQRLSAAYEAAKEVKVESPRVRM